MKALVIGDTHFENNHPGLIDHQLKTLTKIIDDHKPKMVIFLGDIFHHRKPHPEVIVKAFKFFKKLALIPGLSNIFILRGNHDSANKSDDGLTALEVFDYPGSKVTLVTQSIIDARFNFVFIPHYEDENQIKEDYELVGLANDLIVSENAIVFGHYGYKGCMNATGFFDFNLDKSVVNKYRTILGHIHQYAKDDNITILGTPWSTNFGEVDYPHYVGILNSKNKEMTEWSELELHELDYGIRHMVVPQEALEDLREEISDKQWYTVLRVLINKFSDDNSNDLRSEITKSYGVADVNLKFQPIFDKKLNNRLSDFDPQKALQSLDGDIIDKYLEEQKSSIPTEDLKAGLDKINQYADLDY